MMQTSHNNMTYAEPALKMSRIESDIETIKGMVGYLEQMTDRIVQHARSLGYSETPSPVTGSPTPVITTMADAIKALSRAVDHCSGAINLFE